ncbi:MAG: 50S ribosomal protein L19 [Bacilli bacterium]|nr:50S ribosomal protein L19 [Bacilli bacterium]
MNLIDKITNSQIRTDLPEFRVGDNVRVNLKIEEKDSKGNKKIRIQAFEGLVMAIQGSGVSKTFTVRKISGNVGTEKTLPVNSPKIDSIEVVRKGKVRRAKLNFIRDLKKTPKIKERN